MGKYQDVAKRMVIDCLELEEMTQHKSSAYHNNLDENESNPRASKNNLTKYTNSDNSDNKKINIVSNDVAKCCIEKLNLKNAKLGVEYYYSGLPFCIIDAVFSINITYNTTRNVVERFGKFINIDTCRDFGSDYPSITEQFSINEFINFYKNNNIDFITTNVYKNKCRTSTQNGILKSEAVLEYAEVLQRYEINYFQDIIKVFNNLSFEKDIKAIKGQKSGISLSYFFMLAGDNNLIKPDRMIQRFVQECSNKLLSLKELESLFNSVIKILQVKFPTLTLRELDHEIWKLMSSSKTN